MIRRTIGGYSLAVLAVVVSVAGTTLLLRPAEAHIPITTTVLFNREVVRILERRCFHCHTRDNIAMSFETFEEARPWARAIKEEILTRQEPPWRAVKWYGDFANDASLTDHEVAFLISWVDGGAPKGDEADLPSPDAAARTADRAEHHHFSDPDLLLSSGPSKVEEYADPEARRFVITTGLDEDRWLQALRFIPGDRRVVASAFFYVKPGQEAGVGPGQTPEQWLGGWTPWQGMTTLPEGVAIRIPAQASVIMEIHYRGTEEATTDQSQLGLYLSADPPIHRFHDLVAETSALEIDPGGGGPHRAEVVVPSESYAFALRPEMSLHGQSLEVTAAKPDGTFEVLLWMTQRKQAWETPYVFREPILLPAGTNILLTTHYENPSDEAITEQSRVTLSLFSKAPRRGDTP